MFKNVDNYLNAASSEVGFGESMNGLLRPGDASPPMSVGMPNAESGLTGENMLTSAPRRLGVGREKGVNGIAGLGVPGDMSRRGISSGGGGGACFFSGRSSSLMGGTLSSARPVLI